MTYWMCLPVKQNIELLSWLTYKIIFCDIGLLYTLSLFDLFVCFELEVKAALQVYDREICAVFDIANVKVAL